MTTSDDVERRRRARARWPVVRGRVADEPADDLSDVTMPAERIAMMWPLAEAAWKLSGRSFPTYDRLAVPGRLFRPGSPPLDDDA